MKGKYLVSLLDYFVYLLTVFVALFALAFLQISQESSKGNVTEKAEFIIEMTWENDSNNDIDLWVAGPDNNIVYFARKDGRFIILDRDDIAVNNSIVTAKGLVSNPTRREVATIRKVVAGTYTVNVFMYKNRDGNTNHPKVTIRKLNPYNEVTEETVSLTEDGEEKTILTFDLDDNGNVISKNTEYRSLVAGAQ